MRVCLLSPELPPYLFGGIGQYVLTLAKELDRLGHEVTVAGFQIHPQREIRHSWGRSLSISGLLDGAPKLVTACARGMEQFVDRADPIVNLQNVPFLWRLGHAWSLRQILDGAIAVRRYLKDTAGRFDVVELPNYPGHGALLPAIASPYVVRLSTPAAECGSSTNFYVTALERRACHSARHVIADSDTMRSKAEEIYRIQPSKLSVIHHGLDDVLMDTRGPAGGRLVFTYCGRAEARKGTDILIRALGRLLPTQPDVLIRFIGADVDAFVSSHRELSQAWSELKARHGHQIDQVGTVSEHTRDSFLAASDWTIIPSRSESFGLVAVESMRVGTPVIAAAVGGLAEVCGMCPENVLYEPHSVLDLESALRRACDAGRGSMPVRRQAARATYLSHFTASRMVESTLEVYRSVCD